MTPILGSFPDDWQRIVWDNGRERCYVQDGRRDMGVFTEVYPASNLGPYGRFAAIGHATNDIILTQDDDVIVSDPQAIADEWYKVLWESNGLCGPHGLHGGVVANMPPEFRPHYPDSCMVGFGAAFYRGAPEMAFKRFFDFHGMARDDPLFLRESCRIFTTLTPRVLVDVPKTDLPYASDPDRLWMQRNHLDSRERALTMARQVRDAR